MLPVQVAWDDGKSLLIEHARGGVLYNFGRFCMCSEGFVNDQPQCSAEQREVHRAVDEQSA